MDAVSSGDLSIIDGETTALVATVPLGKRPRGIKVAPDGRSLYWRSAGLPSADRAWTGKSGRIVPTVKIGDEPLLQRIDVCRRPRSIGSGLAIVRGVSRC